MLLESVHELKLALGPLQNWIRTYGLFLKRKLQKPTFMRQMNQWVAELVFYGYTSSYQMLPLLRANLKALFRL